MDRKGTFPSRTLAGTGMLLGLMLLSLCLIMLMDSAPVRAAVPLIQQQGKAPWVSIEATATATNTVFLPFIHRETAKPGNIWHAEYFNNRTLKGEPACRQDEVRIDYDWGDDGPDCLLYDDSYSIRWTGDWDFEVGDYTFFVYSDDGVRLWLDNELLINAWSSGAAEHTATRRVGTAGPHLLKLEYFEEKGDAAISLRWRRTDLYPVWAGAYFNNPWAEGNSLYEEDVSVIQFDWGEDCPERLPETSCNSFSAAWNANPLFETGEHRIHVYADEGYQLYVDGDEVQEGGWADPAGGGEDDWYDLDVKNLAYHEIEYLVHDRGGPAEARLWIENLAHPEWYAEYFNNIDLEGFPMATEDESAVFYDWGTDRPHRDLPRDNFSIRWSGKRYFHSGCYRFGLFADDGVRLKVDGVLLINEWHSGRAEYQSPLTYLSSGDHDIVIEYLEYAGEAEIRFWWE